MSDGQREIIQGQPLKDDERSLIAFFVELETKQLDFLDGAGKALVERVAGLLAVLFAVTAFGQSYPPAYLKSATVKYLAIGVLCFYLSAMFLAMRSIEPRTYSFYRHNLTRAREELARMVENKSRSVRLAGICFWVATALLALLVGNLVWSA
jgi:p-aminobenzoyl-glutamate transporter AbgT